MSRLLLAALLAASTFAQTQPPGDWRSYGRDLNETHFSPLTQIDASNIARLGLAFATDVNTPGGNLEATPIVVNGTLYTSLTWGVIIAADARTGEMKWRFDPDIPRTGPGRPGMCCGAINRGVAFHNNRIYASLINGRLVALDANTGRQVWSVQTTDPNTDVTITGAVRIVKDKVIVGTAGAEFNVRGYFSAYDTETGALAWRFYTVPGDPSKPFEHPELETAAKTWNGEWWKYGGGGTVWDGMAYDAEANLLYIGTGNGSPWNREYRSPGGGDNLYLCSILAVNPDTGRLAWHYQTTPGETWDYTSVQSFVLADLEIGGRARKVIMQAPKNGFFYVLDRVTGELLSAEPFSEVTWATGIDKATGRPVEAPGMRYLDGPVEVSPGSGGGHNWHPMAYSPLTKLVYIPGANNSRMYNKTPTFEPQKGRQITGVEMNDFAAGVSPAGARITNRGNFLKAWDPVAQSARWTVPYQGGFSGGALATAGNLVFAVSNDRLTAYSADKGEQLWEQRLSPGVGTPISYEIDGKQYIGVLAGRGGNAPARFYAFVLDGSAPMPAAPVKPAAPKPAKPKPETRDVDQGGPDVLRIGQPAVFTSQSPCEPVATIFEDDGETGYFYAMDLTIEGRQIVDAVHIYNVGSVVDRDRESSIEILWSHDGTKSALLINRYPHAVFDFSTRRGYCRTGFPARSGWSDSSYEWDDAVMDAFD